MQSAIFTILLLIVSNVFMTFAWYGHLKFVPSKWPIWAIVLISWGVALFEYCFMVPANRIGSDMHGGPFSLVQLKVIQEAITLVVFTVIAMFVFGGMTLRWNHIVAFLMLVGAVYLVFMK